MIEERRSAPRFRAYFPVRLHKATSPPVIETLTKDLSVGGMRCLSPTIYPVSTEVSVELMLGPGEEQLTLRGKTAWFLTLSGSDQFEFGIQFFDLTPQYKRRLSVFLDRLSQRSGLIPA